MTRESVLNSVEEVLEDIRQGKIVIVVDDEDRENEGDFIVAAERSSGDRQFYVALRSRCNVRPIDRRSLQRVGTGYAGGG